MFEINPIDYPNATALRDWNPASTSLVSHIFVGACMDKSVGVHTGDVGVYDSAVDIRSADIVLVRPLEKTDDQLFEFYTKGLVATADQHRPGKHQWWLHSDDGMFLFMPEHHAIVGRLVGIGYRRRDLPLSEELQREHDAIASLSTEKIRDDLYRLSLPARRLIYRDGLDRTTMFRSSQRALIK